MPIPQYNVHLTDTGGMGGNYNALPAPKPKKKPNWLQSAWNAINSTQFTGFNAGMGVQYTPPQTAPTPPTPPRQPNWFQNTWNTLMNVTPSQPYDPYNTGWQPANYNPYAVTTGTNRRINTLPPIGQMPQSMAQSLFKPKASKPGFFNPRIGPMGAPYPRAQGDPIVQAYIDLMKGTPLSMSTFDPYEAPLTGDPYDHGTYVPTNDEAGGWGDGGGGGGWGGWGDAGWGGWGDAGEYTPMPSSPNYTGYGGGYNPSNAPRAAYYQGRYGGYGSGNGGYVGSQSQRGAWYGALLQWNI